MRVIFLCLFLIGCANPYSELDSELKLVMKLVQEPRGLNCAAINCNDKEKELLAEYWGNVTDWSVVETRKVAWKKITTVEVTTTTGKKGRLMVVLSPQNGAIQVAWFKG